MCALKYIQNSFNCLFIMAVLPSPSFLSLLFFVSLSTVGPEPIQHIQLLPFVPTFSIIFRGYLLYTSHLLLLGIRHSQTDTLQPLNRGSAACPPAPSLLFTSDRIKEKASKLLMQLLLRQTLVSTTRQCCHSQVQTHTPISS